MRFKPIYGILAAFAIARFLFSRLTWHFVEWDEAVYLGMAKFIHSFGASGLWEVIRPIGLPVTLAGLPKELIFAELLLLTFSIGVLYLTYLITTSYLNEKAGNFAAGFLALTPLFFFYSDRVYTGIPSAFFVLLSIHLFNRKKHIWCGIAAGFAFLFRFPAGIILPVLIISSMQKDLRKTMIDSSKIFIAFALTIIPNLIVNSIYYYSFYFPFVEAAAHQNNLFFSVGNIAQNIVFYPFVIIWQNPIFAFMIAGLIFFHRKIRPVYLAFILFLAYFTIITNKQPRFALLFLPLAMILATYGIARILNRFKLKQVKLAIAVVAIFSLSLAVYHDHRLYDAQHKDAPEIVEYYRYFSDFDGVVLTTDPTPVIYSDAKFIPAYQFVANTDRLLRETDWDAFIWFPSVMPCYNPECDEQRTKMIQGLDKYDMIIYGEHIYDERRIYLKS